MRKILATGATRNYGPVIRPYLETISARSNFDANFLVMLDCELATPPNVTPVRLGSEVLTMRHSNHCLQHGEFLRAPEFAALAPEDIICFTDGDVLLQRPLAPAELALLESLADGEVLVQFNAGEKDHLLAEYHRLGPASPHGPLEAVLGVRLEAMSCYNTGVVICSKRTWEEILRLYGEYLPVVARHAGFAHYASQQWILSFVFGRHLRVRRLPSTMHSHFHHGRSAGSRFERNVHLEDGEVVLFSHFAMREGLPVTKEGFARHQAEYVRHHLRPRGWRRFFRLPWMG